MHREEVRISIPEPTCGSNYYGGLDVGARTYIIMVKGVESFDLFPVHVFILDDTLNVALAVCVQVPL